MKTFLKLFVSLLCVIFISSGVSQAQNKTITASASWVATSSTPLVATTLTNASTTYTTYMNPFVKSVKYMLKTSTVSGSSLAKAVMYTSFDFSNWTKVDSVICTGAVASTPSTVVQTVYVPYVKWEITAYTNAQSTNWQLFISAEKPQ